MTASEYLLNLGLLAFVLYSNLGTHAFGRRQFVRPILLSIGLGSLFLGSIPGAGNDRVLEAAGLLAGLTLGVLSALLVRVRRTNAGVTTSAGVGFAALWIAAIGGRVAFAYGADHWFSSALVTFSRTHDITSSDAWTSAFVLMAIAMVLSRVLVTGAQAAMLHGGLSTRTPATA
ncbi:hypothetical protein acdb102_32100 [Acidothermaceae bacterium B102]|nr:hypothetical protein acdb102_32100 [Acidothermaceae bacterium B102]